MPQGDVFILVGIGGSFVFLGLVVLIWGKIEEKRHSTTLTARTDMREFLDHQPQRPELGSLKIGGWIAITIGLVMIVTGGIFLLFS